MNSGVEQKTPAVEVAKEKLARIRDEIANATHAIGTSPDSVRVVGASKAQPLATIRTFTQAGLAACGENYLQEALPKIDALQSNPIEWHFIGHLQSNKAKHVAEHFDWMQTLDGVRLAKRLNAARLAVRPHEPLNCCIQVNVDNEPQKAGVQAEGLDQLLAETADAKGLRMRGIMAITAPYPDLNDRIASFERVRALFERAAPAQPKYWDTISMGMSGDYLTAIRCGANLVRLGTVLFGPRPPK